MKAVGNSPVPRFTNTVKMVLWKWWYFPFQYWKLLPVFGNNFSPRVVQNFSIIVPLLGKQKLMILEDPVEKPPRGKFL